MSFLQTERYRARSVDALRQSGAQVMLFWGSFSYPVIVEEFEADYKNEWEIAYHITCVVVSESPPFAGLIPTLTSAVFGDVGAVALMATQIPGVVTSITPPMAASLAISTSTLNAAVGTGTLDDLSLSQLQPVIGAFQSTFNTFAVGNGVPAGIDLDAITPTSTLDGFNAFAAETNNAAADSDVQTAMFYLGRILQNLTQAAG